jgi:hypothetical protein
MTVPGVRVRVRVLVTVRVRMCRHNRGVARYGLRQAQRETEVAVRSDVGVLVHAAPVPMSRDHVSHAQTA